MEIQLLTLPCPAKTAQTLAHIWARAVSASHSFLRMEDFAELRRNFVPVYLNGVQELWLAKEGEAMAGFMGCNGNVVEMLFVDPFFWRRGIGRSLLALASGRHGKLKIFVNEQNDMARKFYAAMGFEEIGRSCFDGEGRPYPLLELAEVNALARPVKDR